MSRMPNCQKSNPAKTMEQATSNTSKYCLYVQSVIVVDEGKAHLLTSIPVEYNHKMAHYLQTLSLNITYILSRGYSNVENFTSKSNSTFGIFSDRGL